MKTHPACSRRDFLKTASAATLSALAAGFPRAMFSAEIAAEKLKATADTVIVLWMGGGMAHTETFDPKRYTPFEKGMSPDSFLSTFPNIPTAVDGIRFSEGLEKMAAVMDRGTLIKHFVSMEFHRFLQQYSGAPDLNEGVEPRRDTPAAGGHGGRNGPPAGGLRSVALRVNIGRRDGLEPAEIIQAVNSVTRGRRVAIGRISMKDDFTVFDVEENEAEAVAAALRDLEYGGQEVRVTMAGHGGMIAPPGPRAATGDRADRGGDARGRGRPPQRTKPAAGRKPPPFPGKKQGRRN